jgi:hypothetical protein
MPVKTATNADAMHFLEKMWAEVVQAGRTIQITPASSSLVPFISYEYMIAHGRFTGALDAFFAVDKIDLDQYRVLLDQAVRALDAIGA